MSNKIIGVILTIFVGVILLGSVIMTVINDATDDQRTVYNNTATDKYSLLYDDDLDSINATIELRDYVEKRIHVTIGTETESIPATVRNNMLMSDMVFVRADPSNSQISIYMAGEQEVITNVVLPFTITVTNGVVNLKDSSTIDYTITPTEWMFIPDLDGNYEVARKESNGVYINSIKDIYFSTVIEADSLGFVSSSNGVAKFYDSNETYNMEATSIEKVDGYVDLYRLDMANYQISTDAGVNSDGTGFHPYLTMVPISVDAHTEQERSIISLLSVIPLLFIFALITTAVSIIRSKW